MNTYELKLEAKKIAKEWWNLDFNLPIEQNGRLTRALGRYCYMRSRMTGELIPKKIEVATRLLQNYSDETIISVLKHELTHWALSVMNKPFADGHPVFERELKRVGAHSTGVITQAGTIYTVVCEKCKDKVAESNTPGKLRKYVAGGTRRRSYSTRCCNAGMEWGPTRYVEDTNGVVDTSLDRSRQRQMARELAATASMQTQGSAALAEVPTPKREEVPVTSSNVDISAILIPGPRGVSNKQMIPAIMKAIDLNSVELINELQNQYPSVFEGSKKYLNKGYKSRYEVLMG